MVPQLLQQNSIKTSFFTITNRNILYFHSTNRAVYSGSQTVRIRALLLTTSLKPYDGIADLYLIDPDGYIIRKWNSMEMNVGVLLQDFDLPDWPKVMTIAPLNAK